MGKQKINSELVFETVAALASRLAACTTEDESNEFSYLVYDIGVVFDARNLCKPERLVELVGLRAKQLGWKFN